MCVCMYENLTTIRLYVVILLNSLFLYSVIAFRSLYSILSLFHNLAFHHLVHIHSLSLSPFFSLFFCCFVLLSVPKFICSFVVHRYVFRKCYAMNFYTIIKLGLMIHMIHIETLFPVKRNFQPASLYFLFVLMRLANTKCI